ncbi:phage tail protein [Hymenobacter armeniacus]|uniref:Phage tail protein n=1 Tax=Hymenobacter armeniacus TaxID=2771358 RepID=A0ABR8JUT6_9BACT|nr:tail fiber protein [Hymenobacter armeniacus]MBD2722350.1 phage tail protein [Hymenobacter armeniacus]
METPFTPDGPVATSLSEAPHQAEPTRRGWLKGLGALLGGLFLSRAATAGPASVKQVESFTPFLGEIQIFAFGFTPRGWAQCNGQLLPINQNQALFSLLGTQFGGNGQTTFALPDMRSRTPVHFGQSPLGGSYNIGQAAGTETLALTAANLPLHAHGYQAQVSSQNATGTAPVGTAAAVVPPGTDLNGEAVAVLAYAPTPDTGLSPSALANTGGSQPIGRIAPYETLNFCIALGGIFPSPT